MQEQKTERRRKHSPWAARAAIFFGATATGLGALESQAFAADPPPFDTSHLQTLSDGLAWYALMMCLVGMLISSSLWAIGSKGQNPGQELTGKRGFIVCLTAAFFIGAIPNFINWLDTQAKQADDSGVTSIKGNPIDLNAPANANK